MKKIISSLLVFISFLLYSQDIIEFSGKIVNEKNNQNVPYPSVSLKNLDEPTKVYGELANENGEFSIKIPKGRYEIDIEAIDFETKIYQDSLFVSKNNEIIKLIFNSANLKEVTVKGEPPLYKFELDKKVYDLSQDLSTKGSNLSDVLQNVPSVNVDIDGTVSLRGNTNVRFLIDGKPSALLGIASSADALRQFSADQIEKIEVITNPSSRYEAEGTAGIINIVLKKGRKNEGFNGSIESYVGYFTNYGANVNLNWKKNNWGWFVNTGINYAKPEGKNNVTTKKLDQNSNIDTISFQKGNRLRKSFRYNINTGLNFNLNSKSSIQTTFTYRYSDENNNNINAYKDYVFLNNLLFNSSERNEDNKAYDNDFQANINYDYNFNDSGKKLNINLNSNFSKEDASSTIRNIALLPVQVLLNSDKTINNQDQQRNTYKIDYVNPFKEGALFEMGTQFSNNIIKNDFSVATIINSILIINSTFTDTTEYNEKITSGYIQYGNTYNKFSYQIGLRAENSDIKVSSFTNNSVINKNYLDFFPSLFLNYSFNDNNQIQLNFSRRINRPNGRFLIPFFNYSDDRNTFVGNQNLNPAYTISSELSFIKKIGKLQITPTLFHKYTTDYIDIYVSQDATSNTTIATPVNAGKYNEYGIEIGFMYNPFTWWRMLGEINVYGYNREALYNGTDLSGNGVTISGKYNASFKLPGKIDFQIQNNLRGAQKSAQNNRSAVYSMNIGLSKDFLKNNASLTLNIRDIFNSRKRIITTTTHTFIRDLELQFRQRQINLTFTYRLNQKKKIERSKNREDNGGGDIGF